MCLQRQRDAELEAANEREGKGMVRNKIILLVLIFVTPLKWCNSFAAGVGKPLKGFLHSIWLAGALQISR